MRPRAQARPAVLALGKFAHGKGEDQWSAYRVYFVHILLAFPLRPVSPIPEDHIFLALSLGSQLRIKIDGPKACGICLCWAL